METITEVAKFILGPGMLFYTILLALVVAYWVFFLFGGVALDVLNVDGLLEGLGEGVGEAGAEALEGAAEALEGGAEAASGAAEGMSAVVGFINLGQVPVTIIGSVIIFQMWVVAYVFNRFLPESWRGGTLGLVVGIGAFCFILCVSVFLAGLTTRPFRGMFQIHTTHGHGHLVGKTCRIRTSTVSDRFGQAELKVDHAFLNIPVRCTDPEVTWKKGDEAVIVGYDEERNVYQVQRMSTDMPS